MTKPPIPKLGVGGFVIRKPLGLMNRLTGTTASTNLADPGLTTGKRAL